MQGRQGLGALDGVRRERFGGRRRLNRVQMRRTGFLASGFDERLHPFEWVFPKPMALGMRFAGVSAHFG
jgi:hypothetical protein